MKKYIYLSVFISFLTACSGSKTEEEIVLQITKNEAPTLPMLITPADNLLCINNTVNFEWEASKDIEGDLINYTIEIAKDNQFANIEHKLNTTNTTISVSLEKGNNYYWRVKATDSKNDTKGFVTNFQFFTENEVPQNHIPFLPELIAPNLNSVIQSPTALLQWSSIDLDNDDLVFDVYFGKDNPPLQKISSEQVEKVLTVEIVSSTTYFWKIVVLDAKGGKTIGQVWDFKTD